MNKYKVEGLRHSGIMQIAYKKPAEETSTSSAPTVSSSESVGGGGSGVICISNWQCSEWSECIGMIKNRKCTDANGCTFPTKKPRESEQCLINAFKASIQSNDKNKKIIFRKNFFVESNQSKLLSGITGMVAGLKQNANKYSNFVDIFVVMIVIAAAYLAASTFFLKEE